jgi:cobalt-zinc-cadmium efflux system outer membrane protein
LRFLFLVLLGAAPFSVPAQPSPQPLTVEEAIAAAIHNNPRLSAAAREVAAARSGVRAAHALANPEVLFTPGLQAGGSDEEVLVRQPLELNGTRAARTGVARARLQEALARAVVELRSLVAETKNAYYELIRAREILALSQDLLKTAEEFDRITRRMVELGRRPGIEQTQTGIETARARQQVAQAESKVSAAAAALNTLMGRATSEPPGPLSPLTFASQPVDEQALMQQALAARAEIVAEEAAAETFRQEARLVRAEGLPDLAPQFRVENVTRGGARDAGIGIGLTLPLFDWGSRRSRFRQVEESARAQADRIAAARNQVRQEVAQALARLRAAKIVLQSYREGILDQSRRLLEAGRTGFQEGQTGVLAVLEAQRTYRNVQTEYVNAQVEYALAQAELERATGAVPAARLEEGGKQK